MNTFVALLRAVNVGGKNKLPMSTLRASLEAAGFADVVTYIQSGNVVVKASERSSTAVARRVEAAIEAEFGLEVEALVRSGKELVKVIDSNPFVGRVPDVTKLHVLFLDRKPDVVALETLAQKPFAPDEFVAGASEVYLHCPDGVGRSKLVIAMGPKLTPAVATMRNWNTVTKLAQMATS